MAELPKKPIDFEKLYRKLEALPHNKVGEIINGILHASPRPAGPHGRATSALGMDIGSPFDSTYASTYVAHLLKSHHAV